ncbi:hypothetical protein ABT093_20835 [Kitasatospora sp. NPDC002551]|uniref:hypothetical protein n=1 Tax=Kitasatospora sp. NPDC002551 TaxID=3154539 RepID=UPI003320CB5A
MQDDDQAEAERAWPAIRRVVLKDDRREAGPLGRPRATEMSADAADHWDETIWRRA